MITYLNKILAWSEVWAPAITLLVLFFRKKQPHFLVPVIVYLWFALFINSLCDIISEFKEQLHLPEWLMSNTPLYNVHSIVRFICFSFFFIGLKQSSFVKVRKAIALVFALAVLINFIFFDDIINPNSISGNLFTIEAYLLLMYCLQYYLSQLRDEVKSIRQEPDFWVVTGLSIYVVVNFFVFLFYDPMITNDIAESIWNVHNIAYVILFLFIIKAFYASTGYKPAV